MATFDAIAELPLRIDDYVLEALEQPVSSEFTRFSTVVRLRGAGAEGVGEDVSYAPEAHTSLQAAGAVQPLAGDWTLASFCDHVEALDLWPEPPASDAFVHYRLWAFESAALESLALALAAHDPERVVERGYAVVDDRAGTVITSAAAAREAGAIRLFFADAAVEATTDEGGE